MDEKRDFHPLVKRWLVDRGLEYKHEAKLAYGQVDFMARTRDRQTVFVVECKLDCKKPARMIAQVVGYAAQTKARPAIAVPEDTLTDEAIEACRLAGVELWGIPVPKQLIIAAPLPSPADDDRPLPLIVAGHWGFPLQYHVIDGEHWYALRDWVAGVTQSRGDALRMQLGRLKADSTVTFNVTVESYLASNGKTYRVPFARDRGLYDATQALRPLNSRENLPGIHRAILSYLSAAGVLMDEYRRDPGKMIRDGQARYARMGKSPEWVKARTDGIAIHNELTRQIKVVSIKKPTRYLYAQATNRVYTGLFHRDARRLKRALRLRASQNLRDHLNIIPLLLISLAEEIASDDLGGAKELTHTQTLEVVGAASELVGISADMIQEHKGIDLVTGKVLLPPETSD